MSTARRFGRNILSNWLGLAVRLVVTFLLSPFIVHSLGDRTYGLWTLVVSLIGYYGLLDVGIGAAVAQYMTRYLAKQDLPGVNRTLNTALVLTSAVAAVALAVTVVMSLFLPAWFPMEGVQPSHAQWAIFIMGTGIALGFPLAVYASVLVARERFDILSGLSICDRLLSAGLILWFLKAGYGLLGMAIATFASTFLSSLVRVWVATYLLPGLVLRPSLFARQSVREIASFGFYKLLVSSAERIIAYSDALVVGLVMGSAAVTYYSIGASPAFYFWSIVAGLTFTFTPYATACDARGDRAALRQLLLTGTRTTVLLASFIACGLIVLGSDFLRLWMGAKYVSGETYASSATVLAILALATLVRATHSCGRQILFGMRRMRFLAILSFADALLNLAISLVLVRFLGLVGVALGTLIPLLVSHGIIQPAYLLSSLDVRWRGFLGQIARPAIPIAVTMVGLEALVGRHLPADDWPQFLLRAAVVALPALLAGLALGTTSDERRLLLATFRGQRPPRKRGPSAAT